MSADERVWISREGNPEDYGAWAMVAMALAGPEEGGYELCRLLMLGEAVPLDRLVPEEVKRYGLRRGVDYNGRARLTDFNLLPVGRNSARPDLDTEQPFALADSDFAAELDAEHQALLGSRGDVLIPDQGLVVVAGLPGVGKTTVVLDLVYHLASGLPWLDIPVARPLNVLIVENEGPQHMFRSKIDTKRNAWQAEVVGEVWVQTWRWGLFSLADPDARRELQLFNVEHPLDVIVGDPLGTLGVQGAGSPEDTRRFVLTLLEMELRATWLFVHHFRKDPSPDEVNQLSGAWAGHLDTLMLVKPTRREDEVRLSFPKTRWVEGQRKALILGYVKNTQALELLGEEGDPAMAVHTLVHALADGVALTTTEAAKAAGLRRAAAEETLKGNAHLFQLVPGADVGRPKASKGVWQLVPEGGTTSRPHGEGDGAQPVPSLFDGTTNGTTSDDEQVVPALGQPGQADQAEQPASGEVQW